MGQEKSNHYTEVPEIKVENLSKSFGNTLILQNVNFSVPKGKVLSIIGPSGIGKTTLLRCLNLLEIPTSGKIFWEGRPIIENSDQSKRPKLSVNPNKFRQKIGMVFQEYNLWPNKTVLENIIEAPCHVKKMSQEKAIEKAKKLCEEFGIGDKIYEYPLNLSGGQKQRAAFARALAMEPEVLLLDEVTSALDPEMIGEILDLITRLSSKGYTMVIVTHHLGFAHYISDEVLFLADHTVVEYGPPYKVIGAPSDPRTRNFVESILDVEPNKLIFDIRARREIPEEEARVLYNAFELDRARRKVKLTDEEVFRYQMNSKHPFVRLLAYNLFRKYFRDEDYNNLIQEFRESNDPYFKIPMTFQILAKFNGDAGELLEYVKQHPKEYIEHNLQYFGGEVAILNYAKSRLNNPDHYAKRFLYAFLLGLIGNESCLNTLRTLSKDENEIVKREALAAIKNIELKTV